MSVTAVGDNYFITALRLAGVDGLKAHDAFKEVGKRLKEFPEKIPTSYKHVLVSYITEEVNNLNVKEFFTEVNQRDQKIVNEVTEKIKKSLKKSNKNAELHISPKPINTIGGVMINTEDNKQYYVNTFESILVKIKSENQGKVPEILLKFK